VLSPGLSPIAHSKENVVPQLETYAGAGASPLRPAVSRSSSQSFLLQNGRNASFGSTSGAGNGTAAALQELGALCGELCAEVAEQSLHKVQRLAVVARDLAGNLGGVRGQALGSRLESVCNELARDFDLLRLEGEAASRSSSRCSGPDGTLADIGNTSRSSLDRSGVLGREARESSIRLVPAPVPGPGSATAPIYPDDMYSLGTGRWQPKQPTPHRPPPVQLSRRALPRPPARSSPSSRADVLWS
jgi:hypothetical protein